MLARLLLASETIACRRACYPGIQELLRNSWGESYTVESPNLINRFRRRIPELCRRVHILDYLSRIAPQFLGRKLCDDGPNLIHRFRRRIHELCRRGLLYMMLCIQSSLRLRSASLLFAGEPAIPAFKNCSVILGAKVMR